MKFRGEYGFLSNFYTSRIVVDGKVYPTVEHYYQASKCEHPWEHELVRLAPSPSVAKELGRKIYLKLDFPVKLKLYFMKKGLVAKFTQNPKLAKQLLATGTMLLVEENHWGDEFWGVCGGKGENHLGKLLMEVRELLVNRMTAGSLCTTCYHWEPAMQFAGEMMEPAHCPFYGQAKPAVSCAQYCNEDEVMEAHYNKSQEKECSICIDCEHFTVQQKQAFCPKTQRMLAQWGQKDVDWFRHPEECSELKPRFEDLHRN